MSDCIAPKSIHVTAVDRRDVISISGLHFAWPGANPFALTVDSFNLAGAERVMLLGPSGSGKSTLLSLIAGIVTPKSGRLEVLGTDIATLSNAARDRFRADHVGIIFQMFNLLPYGSVIDNVVLPLSFSTLRRQRVEAAAPADREAARLLERLGMDAQAVGRRRASTLSVGQQQRVAAARALIGRPELIIADEPTSALDRGRQSAFLDLMFEEIAATGASLLMVSHDETLGHRFDRVLRLDEIVATERGAT